jgi:ABC-type multidrug transport system permease subunit
VSFLGLPPLNAMPMFITILAFVATAVYWLDARPALRRVDPRRRGR